MGCVICQVPWTWDVLGFSKGDIDTIDTLPEGLDMSPEVLIILDFLAVPGYPSCTVETFSSTTSVNG